MIILDFVRKNWHSGNIEKAEVEYDGRNRKVIIITLKGGYKKVCRNPNSNISGQEYIDGFKGWGDFD